MDEERFDELLALLELLGSQIEHLGNRMDYVISRSKIQTRIDRPPPRRIADRKAAIMMALGD